MLSQPFFTALEPFLQGKKVVIFGSYGWGGQSIALVQKELEEAGLNIFHDMIRIANQPTQEELDNIYTSIIEKL
jgi:flavorubredoxin